MISKSTNTFNYTPNQLPPCIIIIGPTGVGKSDVAERIAQHIPAAIVNGDMGQWYTPLTIGTAKPDWKNSATPHYLFDILNEPALFTVAQYRQSVLGVVKDLGKQKKIPIIVGGSSFYIKSLLFPPLGGATIVDEESLGCVDDRWQQLQKVDPQRAAQLHPHDIYRITRALALYQQTGVCASTLVPQFSPFSPFILINVIRDRAQLHERINERVKSMLSAGWIDEVNCLLETEWESFLLHKKIIGYPEIIAYLSSTEQEDRHLLEEAIAQKTRAYAKRQMSFNRSLVASLQQFCHDKNVCCVQELNLTLTDVELYIKQLLDHSLISSFV